MKQPSETDPLSSTPPEAWDPLVRFAERARKPVDRFLHIEAASGILLLIAAAVALLWVNSPFGASYTALWETPLGIKIGEFTFERSLVWFVNDGLMVIFFFVVGLEIRREIHAGELSELRRAALPLFAALGGVLLPAGLYLALAGAPETRSGWGVPMATDIAFAVGILTLLGKRVPPAMRVLLLAVAVIDDLCAIIVIAVFYSSGISMAGLAVGALGYAGVIAMQRFGVRSKLAYVAPTFVAWAGIYAAGIHPTIAGVIVGLLTPVRAWLGTEGFQIAARKQLDRLSGTPDEELSSYKVAGILQRVDASRREVLSPSAELIHTLHPWVAFGIMPIFALANSGVSLAGGAFDVSAWNIISGVTVGLVLGKTIGVLLASWLTLKLGICVLPRGMGLRHLLVLGIVAGVGFTMAIFIAQLAFQDEQLLSAAKLGVLVASGAAAVIGLIVGCLILKPVDVPGAAKTGHEAESSTEV
ncbi:MAG: Na+/H+ antiporter NhaA [Planctomycetes bacterium]|nr:Na+/H+ antiporter NhaA [Planctomycetota bacterium]